jgi:hypothetical protein
MDQVSIKYLPVQDPPKFTQIWIFWFENKPSGNPGLDTPSLFKTDTRRWVVSFGPFETKSFFVDKMFTAVYRLRETRRASKTAATVVNTNGFNQT